MQPSISRNVLFNTDTNTDTDISENIGEFKLNDSQFNTNSTENTQKSTLKRFVVKYYFLE